MELKNDHQQSHDIECVVRLNTPVTVSLPLDSARRVSRYLGRVGDLDAPASGAYSPPKHIKVYTSIKRRIDTALLKRHEDKDRVGGDVSFEIRPQEFVTIGASLIENSMQGAVPERRGPLDEEIRSIYEMSRSIQAQAGINDPVFEAIDELVTVRR